MNRCIPPTIPPVIPVSNLLTSLVKQQLKRLDLWLISLMGATMILTLTASLLEAQLLSDMTQFLPSPENARGSLTEIQRIQRQIVRGGFFIFQFITLILFCLVLLGDPMNNPQTTTVIATSPLPRQVLFLVRSFSHAGTITVLATLLWGPTLFNALYTGIYILPLILGTLFFTIQILVIYSLYLAIGEAIDRSLAIIVVILFYVLARFDRYLFPPPDQSDNPFGWVTRAVSLLLPPFDRLNESVLTVFAGAPLHFMGAMGHVIVLLVVLTAIGWWYFMNRDFPPA